jgi:hypothetical protein
MTARFLVFCVYGAVLMSFACEQELIAPGESGSGAPELAGKPSKAPKTPYWLQFSGDVVAKNVPAKAYPEAIWTNMETTGPADVTLSDPLLKSQPYNTVNPAACNYTESNTTPDRLNSWHGDAGLWEDVTRIGISTGEVNFRRVVQVRPERVDLWIQIRDQSPTISGNVMTYNDAQALVARLSGQWENLDSWNDPCVTFTITAETAPLP